MPSQLRERPAFCDCGVPARSPRERPAPDFCQTCKRPIADDDGLDDLGPEQPLPELRCPKCDGGLGLEGECVFCSLEAGESE